jgi:hypothetical protein
LKVWEVTVVVEIPVQPHDHDVRAEGDGQADFAARAVDERLRPALEALRASLPGSHWSIRPDGRGRQARECEA